jgi:hypothetical protein
MATLSKESLVTVTRYQNFTDNIDIIPTGTVTEVTCVSEGQQDSGISISSSLSSITISGVNKDIPWNDIGIYVEKGSSDLLETPKQVIGISNIPPGKDLISYSQDLKQQVIKNYNVTVKESVSSEGEEEPPPSPEEVITNFVVTQTIVNDWSSGTTFVRNYYGT